MTDPHIIGFIGLGTMGAPMCLNLARAAGYPVHAYDSAVTLSDDLVAAGVVAARTLAGLAQQADRVFLSLPDGDAVKQVCLGEDGLFARLARGSVIIDMSTSPVDLTRALARQADARGLHWCDAPVARTREAALRGELSIMVGGDAALFAELEPLLRCMGTDVTFCGPVGAGQTVKILNNMLLFQQVCALAEAIGIARRSGLDPAVLLEVVAKGSGDSFALRNHATKSMVPRQYPLRAFSTRYAAKDLSYALALAREVDIQADGAELAMARLQAAIEAGFADQYFPAVLELIDPDPDAAAPRDDS